MPKRVKKKRVVDRVFDVFLDRSLRRDPSSYRRARVIVGLSLSFGVAAALGIAFRLGLTESGRWMAVPMLNVGLLLATPFILAWTGRLRLAGTLVTFSCLAAFLNVLYFEGGIQSPAVIGLPILPLLAGFMINRWAGLGVAAFSVMIYAVLPLLPRWGVVFPQTPLTEADMTTLRIVVGALTVAAIGFFVWIYERERLEAERRLDVTRRAAEQAADAKGQFLANMSHEIRTPMTGIVGLTDLLLDQELSPEARDHATTIASSATRLRRILDDVLDFSRIESDHLVFDEIDFSLRDAVAEAIHLVEATARGKGLALRWEVAETVFDARRGDPGRLQQILGNLLSNAVKFTAEGEIELRVDAGAGDEIRLTVRDSGIGVDPATRDVLFEPFRQADGSTSRRFGGTGLGLAISHRLAIQMGGSIAVESVPGEGATFVVSFRLAAASGELGADSPPPVVLGGGRILVAEDDEVTRMITRRHLEKLGYDVDTATNGLEALAALAGENYSAVLLDCQMPELDGYETCRRIRREVSTDLPVIAFTAHALKGEREKCIAAGMDDYLTKPFRQKDLVRVLSLWCGPTSR